ncbi:MAG: type I DNA topoisomerase [Clostridia bacterium]|nr:type I DNA topoisomerase [Clostridia bacterium]
MAKTSTTNLVIIESPYKVPTIKNYLGSSYRVVASNGHLRDLPKSRIGVYPEDGFKVDYINIRGKGDVVKKLRQEAKDADRVFFATDPDREGEAISWHLASVLEIDPSTARRVCFNELTKNAIRNAIKEPRSIDMNLVDSQQARRILDRLVGYKLSPLLWKKVHSGLSAGRVQSVATRAIVEREREIRSFVPEEYWTVGAVLISRDGTRLTVHFYGDRDGKRELHNGDEAGSVVSAIKGHDFTVTSVRKSVRVRVPMPPFTTSTLQQEASKKLGFRSKKIMQVAQELYEGINVGQQFGGTQGLITYMRTDSLRVSDDAAAAAAKYIEEKYGKSSLPSEPRVYRSKGKIQDAHEAIRPSNFILEPEKIKDRLTPDQFKLYTLIWNRFMASQMASAEYDTINAELLCSGLIFRASGSTLRFPGFLAEYGAGDEEETKSLPELAEGDRLRCEKPLCDQHFTEPPARFSEGTLIKFFEENGIGRPSTYTPTITTIIDRGYVERDGKFLRPTELGEITNDIMVKNFPDIVDYDFTAHLEESLDAVAGGEKDMLSVLKEFYGDFEKELGAAERNLADDEVKLPQEQTDIICEKCGAVMVIRQGRFGRFAACPNYPTCKNTKPIDKDGNLIEKKTEEPKYVEGENCPNCGSRLVMRQGRYGDFIACSNYPTCKYTKEILHPIGVPCPSCGGEVVTRINKKGGTYYGCSNYPDCKFISWDRPTTEKCPKCGAFLSEGRNGALICSDKKCGYRKSSAEGKK